MNLTTLRLPRLKGGTAATIVLLVASVLLVACSGSGSFRINANPTEIAKAVGGVLDGAQKWCHDNPQNTGTVICENFQSSGGGNNAGASSDGANAAPQAQAVSTSDRVTANPASKTDTVKAAKRKLRASSSCIVIIAVPEQDVATTKTWGPLDLKTPNCRHPQYYVQVLPQVTQAPATTQQTRTRTQTRTVPPTTQTEEPQDQKGPATTSTVEPSTPDSSTTDGSGQSDGSTDTTTGGAQPTQTSSTALGFSTTHALAA